MLKLSRKQQWAIYKTAVFLLCLVPFGLIVWDALNDQLGSDPIQTLHFRSGDWALRFLLITLSISPIRRFLKFSKSMRFRRMLGLFSFFYASLHLAVWLVLDQSLSLDNMLMDIPESPYIIVGLIAYGLLILLAVTSLNWLMRKMGRWWQRLHALIYPIAILGVIHFFWLTKLDYQEPVIYALVLAALLLLRWPKAKKVIPD